MPASSNAHKYFLKLRILVEKTRKTFCRPIAETLNNRINANIVTTYLSGIDMSGYCISANRFIGKKVTKIPFLYF